MKIHITVIGLVAALPLALLMPVLQAQTLAPSREAGPHAAKDASQMPESGPAVVGGSGATAGPNARNQAVTPMPGTRQMEELGEGPEDKAWPVQDVPLPSRPRAGGEGRH